MPLELRSAESRPRPMPGSRCDCMRRAQAANAPPEAPTTSASPIFIVVCEKRPPRAPPPGFEDGTCRQIQGCARASTAAQGNSGGRITGTCSVLRAVAGHISVVASPRSVVWGLLHAAACQAEGWNALCPHVMLKGDGTSAPVRTHHPHSGPPPCTLHFSNLLEPPKSSGNEGGLHTRLTKHAVRGCFEARASRPGQAQVPGHTFKQNANAGCSQVTATAGPGGRTPSAAFRDDSLQRLLRHLQGRRHTCRGRFPRCAPGSRYGTSTRRRAGTAPSRRRWRWTPPPPRRCR